MADHDLRVHLLRAIKKSNLRIEEIAPLSYIPEGNLYRLILGKIDPLPKDIEQLALILDCRPADIFP